MKKRIVSFLMALVMAVSLLPVSAFAVDGAYTVAKDATINRSEDTNTAVAQTVDTYADVTELTMTVSDITAYSKIGSFNVEGQPYSVYKTTLDATKYDGLAFSMSGQQLPLTATHKLGEKKLFLRPIKLSKILG